jgi:hypothetical protein
MSSLDKERKPRLQRPCSKCGNKFTPNGTSRKEKLCIECYYKARGKK